MTPSIKIIRCPYEEPYILNLVMEAQNKHLRGCLEFYISADDLIKLADELEVFPRYASAEYLWELGSERSEDRSAYYFRFKLITTDSTGHCAIQLRFNNNEELPGREMSEFCILAEPASLNNLGKLFRKFAKLKHEVLYWEPNGGELFVTREEAE